MVISDYYYNELKSRKERAAFRNEVLIRTGMQYTSFYVKIKHDSWKPLEREAILDIINKRSNA